MRLNKTVKALAIALPILALSACSSTSDESEGQSQTDTNTQSVVEETVQVSAAEKEAMIAEQKRQELAEQLDALRSQHIVYFDFDMSTVSSQFASVLDAHAKFLSENSGVSVLVEGHADERGTPEYNIALGERRAKAVATYLENMGVSSSQISVVSYGEEKPMIKDRSENAFAQNRRAVLVY
jgi:peptidoglycan-associated lipoprotein